MGLENGSFRYATLVHIEKAVDVVTAKEASCNRYNPNAGRVCCDQPLSRGSQKSRPSRDYHEREEKCLLKQHHFKNAAAASLNIRQWIFGDFDEVLCMEIR